MRLGDSALRKDKTGGPPLIAHLIHHLKLGGLEKGVVTLINGLPAERYRHAVVCMTDYDQFRHSIRRSDVEVVALHKRPGQDPGVYMRLWKCLRRLRPTIVHTRNIGALEAQAVAALAGVPIRIHGEHGRDTYDLNGTNIRHLMLRKAMRPLVHSYTAVSRDLADWLVTGIGAPADCVRQIYNGVDTERFRPRADSVRVGGPPEFLSRHSFVVGTVGRLEVVKDQPTLVRAFLELIRRRPQDRHRLRLIIAGDGALRAKCIALLEKAGAMDLAWLPGERSDIPELMRLLDVFVLPSIGEGISNTILEAMASGIPVIATQVGGNCELVEHGRTGVFVPTSNPSSLADALAGYLDNPERVRRHGENGRGVAESRFSLKAMLDGYAAVYDECLRHSTR